MLKYLENNGLIIENMVGFGSDNASVMSGKFGGVLSYLEERCPYLLNLGCTVHSLALETKELYNESRGY